MIKKILDDDENDSDSSIDSEDSDSLDQAPSPPKISGVSKESTVSMADNGKGPVGAASTKESAVKPDGSSKVMDYQKYLVTPEDLKRVEDVKRRENLIGGLTDTLGNSQGFGNFYLGKMNPHSDSSGYFNALKDQANQPLLQKQAMMAQTMKQPQMELQAQLNDPNSTASNLLKANAMAAITQIKANTPQQAQAYENFKSQIPKMTGYQLKQVVDGDPLLKESFSASIQGQKLDQMISRMNTNNDMKVQTALNNDKILNTYIPRLDGAKKIMNLMDVAEKNQDVKSNQALLGQLNAEIARLETGSQSPGLGQAEKTEMKDAAAHWHDVMDTLSGNVTGVDLSKKFAQARGMVNDLAGSYMNQVQDRMNYLQSGSLPQHMPIYQAKMNQMQSTYGNRFGHWGIPGQDQKAGGLINSANAGEAGPQTMMKDGHTYVKVQGGWKLQSQGQSPSASPNPAPSQGGP